MKSKPKSRASALLLATILLFAILTVIISLSSVTVMEMKMSQKGKTSVASFYDAESGVEWALHKVSTSAGSLSSAFPSAATDGSVACPTGVGGAGCKVYFLDESGNAIASADFTTKTFANVQAVRAVGREGNDTQRAIEAAVASGGGACYTCYTGTDSADCCSKPGGPVGFTSKGKLGDWGSCYYQSAFGMSGANYVPPDGPCVNAQTGAAGSVMKSGTAYLCCQ